LSMTSASQRPPGLLDVVQKMAIFLREMALDDHAKGVWLKC